MAGKDEYVRPVGLDEAGDYGKHEKFLTGNRGTIILAAALLLIPTVCALSGYFKY